MKTMMNAIRDFANSIVNLGAYEDIGILNRFNVRLINVSGLVFITILLMAFPLAAGRPFMIFVPIVAMLLGTIGGMYLNSIRQYEMAKFLFVVVVPFLQFINLMWIDTIALGVETIFFPLIMLAAAIYRNKWKKYIIILLLAFAFVAVFISRDYGGDWYYWYSPLVVILGILVGLNIGVEHIQATASTLIDNNEQLLTQNKRLENLLLQNNLKTELLGILSHDLKGPAKAFNQLSKKVSFLLKNERYDDLEEFSNYFEVAGDKIYHDIDRLLNWTIAQKQDIITRVEEIFPHRLINQLIEGLVYQISEKDVTFSNAILQDVGLISDTHILDIILKNLLANAVNHSPYQSEVSINHFESPTHHTISIKNNGTPIDLNIVEEAKVGRYRKSMKGHGLGLGICFSLIKFLNGEIEFEVEDNGATIVHVKLPKNLD